VQAFLSTDNYRGYLDMVHSNIACAAGTSVYRTTCTLAGATAIALPAPAPGEPDVVFALQPGDTVFEDGFE
jgi:hypothetical protein